MQTTSNDSPLPTLSERATNGQAAGVNESLGQHQHMSGSAARMKKPTEILAERKAVRSQRSRSSGVQPKPTQPAATTAHRHPSTTESTQAWCDNFHRPNNRVCNIASNPDTKSLSTRTTYSESNANVFYRGESKVLPGTFLNHVASADILHHHYHRNSASFRSR
jgi:hypothetical protein